MKNERYHDDEPILQLNSTEGEEIALELDGNIEASIISNQEAPMVESPFKVLLELKGVGIGSNEGSSGVDLVTVLDTSGSMKGSKINNLKLAMAFLLQKLGRTDRLSVVTFNRHANKLCPLRQITETSRTEIAESVNDLYARSTTNTEGGLRLAVRILEDRTRTEGRRPVIMLMTDGFEDDYSNSVGVSVDKVPVYTFGYGSDGDYDTQVLTTIAEKSYRGKFTAVPDLDNLGAAFSACLDGFLNVIIEDLIVTITPENGSEITEVNAGNYQPTEASEVDPITVKFGSLFDNGTCKVLVKLILPKVEKGCEVNALNIFFKYRVVGKDIFKSDQRCINVTRVAASKERIKSSIVVRKARLLGIDEELRKVTESLFFEESGEGNQLPNSEERDDPIRELYESLQNDKHKPPEKDEQVQEEYDGYRHLSEAVDVGDWERAYAFLKANQRDIEKAFKLSGSGKVISLLTKAALLDDEFMFVEKIVKLAPAESLAFRDVKSGFTILHMVAMWGNIETVKLVVKKNARLPQICDNKGIAPLLCAVNASDGQNEVLEYLYSETKDEEPSPFKGAKGAALLIVLMRANFYGTALSVLRRFPALLAHNHVKDTAPLELIVQRPFAFLSGANLVWWERYICSIGTVLEMDSYAYDIHGEKGTKCDIENPPVTRYSNSKGTMINNIMIYLLPVLPCIKKLYNQKLMHEQAIALVNYVLKNLNETMEVEEIINFFRNSSILKTAITYGTTEFVLECLQLFPFLSSDDVVGDTMIAMVVEEKNEKIFDLICIQRAKNKSNTLSMFDDDNNGILHRAAKIAPSRQLNLISGAALQMQKEVQWFKAVENVMLQRHRFIRNKKGETAQFLFTQNHKELKKEGEKWMKDTSGSCMLVAALIATVAFATAFTVPGGNISDNSSSVNGIPVFLGRKSFVVFAVADALALFSSITSVLMFLAVFTSRYSEEDFLKSLPQKLIIGLATLLISMATVLIAFIAAFTIVLGERFPWAPIPIALFAGIPVGLFVFMQLPLFVEMIYFTYWPIRFGEATQRRCSKRNKKKEN
ncbi:hypothetical protein MKX03_006571 [Papaver bracteatum]|nr:hypothetical protein MKX03_006571 [Papaver bracteatum]